MPARCDVHGRGDYLGNVTTCGNNGISKMHAILYRDGRPWWRFDWCPDRKLYIHMAIKHEYAIGTNVPNGQPFWVARRHKGQWVCWEKEIGASSIIFVNQHGNDAGEYIFPDA